MNQKHLKLIGFQYASMVSNATQLDVFLLTGDAMDTWIVLISQTRLVVANVVRRANSYQHTIKNGKRKIQKTLIWSFQLFTAEKKDVCLLLTFVMDSRIALGGRTSAIAVSLIKNSASFY